MLKPEFFPSVPRLYNRIYGKIKAGFKDATGCKKWLVDKAVSTKTAAYDRDGTVTNGCWDKIVFSKAAALLGGNVRQMVTGSAPIDKAVIDFIKIVFSCPVSEGYGLTESAAASFITNTRDPTTGHVGGPTEGAKIRFKDLPDMNYLSTDKPYPRGEVCMKGPSIFSGYYKREDKTSEAFDEEGWFLTGDVAVVHPNGAIRIIDRSKNIFKLSQGEYIAPEKLENIFVLSPYIAQSMVTGNSTKNNIVAIVVPDADFAEKWCRQNGIEVNGNALTTVQENDDFKKEIMDDMMRLAKENKLSSLEKPKDICLISDPFTPQNNILTATEKLKRAYANKVFEAQIAAMYAKIEEAQPTQQ